MKVYNMKNRTKIIIAIVVIAGIFYIERYYGFALGMCFGDLGNLGI